VSSFDRIDHTALMDRVRDRIKDKRVLALIKAFLHAGILTEQGGFERSVTGTPQGGIMTAPTQLRTSSLSGRFRGAREGVCREAWYSSG
jgi:retron-type reverse transcriptase